MIADEGPVLSPPLMILDELDSGVGARLGRAVGQTLRRMTRSLSQPTQTSQILCVSHLPQVEQALQYIPSMYAYALLADAPVVTVDCCRS